MKNTEGIVFHHPISKIEKTNKYDIIYMCVCVCETILNHNNISLEHMVIRCY